MASTPPEPTTGSAATPGARADAVDRPARWPAVVTVLAMATWPFASLMATNLDQPLDRSAILTWWGATLAASVVVVAIAMALGRRLGARVGAVVGVFLWVFFSFPTVTALRDQAGVALTARWWWVAVAAVVVVIVAIASDRMPVRTFVAIAAVALLALPASQVAVSAATGGSEPTGQAGPGSNGQAFATTPNVWFFVMDALAGADFLAERTGYDSTPFVESLESDGFQVSDQATSNYPFTNLSIAAALQMDYVFEGVDEPNAGPFFEVIQGNSTTVDRFLDAGYSYVHAYPGFWTGSRCSGREDLCLGEGGSLTDTETALADMTPLGSWVTARSQQADVAITNDPSHVVEQVLDADLAGPTFNFVHVLNPHAPLLRDQDCAIRDVEMSFSAWGQGEEYGDAVECLHAQLESAVDQVLDEDPDALIILQGDHGPRLGIDWDTPDGVLLEEDMYFSILSAVRMPDECADVAVPEDLTTVNTFRLVFSCLEDQPADLLPNRRFPILAHR